MARDRNEIIATKLGIKEDILQEEKKAIKMVQPCHANGGLRNW
jgi:hypothetical protein